MSWIVLTTDDVLSEFTVPENSSIRNLLGGSGSGSASGSGSGPPFWNLDLVTVRVIDELRGYIAAGGYELDEISDPRTIPMELFEDAIAIARWRILVSVPMLKQLQTEERKSAFDQAIKKLTLIAEQKFFVIPPIPDTTARGGKWNAESKLIMRTHPIPRPATQFTPQINTYANPTAPQDLTNTQTSGTLSVGTTYTVILYVDGDDFTNVGGTNRTGAVFVATGTTPTVWTNQSQLQS